MTWTPITIEQLCFFTGLDPSTLPEDCNPEMNEKGAFRARLNYNRDAFKNMVYSSASC